MKTCVFITGTNAVGKTTLAKALIEQYGGIKEASKELTLCNDARVCFAGKYAVDKTFGGVDGFNQTKCLEGVVREGLTKADVIFCEGMYLHTFGLNLTNAMFSAEKHLIVFLYAPVSVINERLLSRAGKGIKNDAVWKKQQNCATAAKKWQSIGVPVYAFDTSKTSIDEIIKRITEYVDNK
jgi:broad-specificity NMP kinase